MKAGLFIGVIFISTASGCLNIEVTPDKEMPGNLQMMINRNQADSFLVDSIDKSDWDEVYILKPYLTEERYQQLQHKVDRLPWLAPWAFSADWFNHLVFCKNGKAIKFLEIINFPCDFSYVGRDPNHNPALVKKGTFLFYKKDDSGRITIYTK
jgi:hypothetical protein